MARLLIADDDPLTLAGIELLVSASLHEVVGTVRDGEAALEQIPVTRPDILLLDFDMPRRSGLEVLRTIRERGDQRAIIILTGSMSDRRVYEALQLGLNGLVIKSAAPEHLLTCLDSVAQGRRWIQHEILLRAMELSLAPDQANDDPLGALSRRERAVVTLLLLGKKNKEIASELGIGEGTVKVHLHKAYEKLGVSSRMELAVRLSGHSRQT